MAIDIDMDATEKLRDQQWREFISKEPYQQMYAMMHAEMARIASMRKTANQREARDLPALRRSPSSALSD